MGLHVNGFLKPLLLNFSFSIAVTLFLNFLQPGLVSEINL